MQAHNSYSEVMFNPAALAKVVAELARQLPALQKQFDFDTIAVAGKSGCAVGFALSMVTGIHVVYVRKGESTHGDMVEGDGHEFTRYAFLDDFVASGATRDRIQEELSRRADSRGHKNASRVLTIEYQTHERGSRMLGESFAVAHHSHLPAPTYFRSNT